jgi:hypothetical protein
MRDYIMKFIVGLLLSWFACSAVAAESHAFYVINVRHTGEALLHTDLKTIPRTDQPYVLVNTKAAACCFRFGAKPGVRKPSVKINEDEPPFSSPLSDESYQNIGYITTAPEKGKPITDALAFGMVGMTAVSSKGKKTYEVAFSHDSKPVIVKTCMGTEGVNFRLYETLADKKPYATYYYYLGYDVERDCD